MTYLYCNGTHEDDEREPIAAVCDMCDKPIHVDEWRDAKNGATYDPRAKRGYMEHVCSDCRILGNRERWEHERAHAVGRI